MSDRSQRSHPMDREIESAQCLLIYNEAWEKQIHFKQRHRHPICYIHKSWGRNTGHCTCLEDMIYRVQQKHECYEFSLSQSIGRKVIYNNSGTWCLTLLSLDIRPGKKWTRSWLQVRISCISWLHVNTCIIIRCIYHMSEYEEPWLQFQFSIAFKTPHDIPNCKLQLKQ